MGAFPDGFRRAAVGRLLGHDIGTAPRAPPPARRRSTRRPGSPRPRRPGRPARPQLRRSRTDKIIGGVSGGLAEYSGIDAAALARRLRRPGPRRRHRRPRLPAAVAAHAGRPAGLGTPARRGQPRSRRRPGRAPRSPASPSPALLIVVGVARPDRPASPAGTSAPRGFLGAALLVVGLGLVAAAFTGGRTARGGLIALGVVLSLGADRRVDGAVARRRAAASATGPTGRRPPPRCATSTTAASAT